MAYKKGYRPGDRMRRPLTDAERARHAQAYARLRTERDALARMRPTPFPEMAAWLANA